MQNPGPLGVIRRGIMISTLICDEQLLFGESLAAALVEAGAHGVQVLTHATQAVAALTAAPASTVVMSLRSDCPAGLEAVRGLRSASPLTRIVCLVAGPDDQFEREAVDAGADDIVLRSHSLARVVSAVLEAELGWTPVPMEARRRALHTEPRQSGEARHLRFLTTRERETFELLVAARSTESIAQEMHITVATARTYVQSVLEKLGVHSRVEAVAYAARPHTYHRTS